MNELLFEVNHSAILLTMLLSSILLVLLDYWLPVDWLAYLGYLLFALFVGATIPADPRFSMISIVGVFIIVLIAHRLVFSKFLTNAPRIERRHHGNLDQPTDTP